MASLFSKPKKSAPVVMPRVQDPSPIPQASSLSGDNAMRSAKNRSGFRKSILTGALEPETSKKKILG